MSLENLESLEITDRKLGEGGFGSVFVCQLGEKEVAAKKLSQSKKEIDNLTREASKLRRLRYGKHIAYTYGFTLKDENLYMVMEYSKRGDLQSYLQRSRESVTYEQRLLFCRGILLGLLYCHSMNVFHGDIKCSNVLLGENLEPKLTDFGLSMTMDNIEGYCKTYEGSIHWAAPELFSIKEEGNFEEFKANPYPTDIYSLGATFCQVSFDGTTEFLGSDDIEMDISLGLVSPIPKDEFLEEIIDKCCQFERNERISLDECLILLDTVAEEQLPIPDIDGKWQGIQQDIKANSKLELPPSFILHRPAKNLVVGPSNLSLLEWLCISGFKDAVEYMTQANQYDQSQIKWFCEISELCKSSEVTEFLQILMRSSKFSCPRLSNLIDDHPQQFIVMLIKAGASDYSYNLLKKAIRRHHNMIVHAFIDNTNYFNDWAIHDAIKFENAEAVKILAGAGAVLKWKDRYTSNTPLITAIDIENIEIVKILLEHGVMISCKNSYTQTSAEAKIQYRPLYLIALKDNREIVKLLIDAGATIDITSDEWHSLSQDLEQQGNANMARFIRNSMSKTSNTLENSPLYAAIQNKQPDLVQTLIDSKVSIGEIGLDGYTPLHWAVIVDDEEIVRILIRAGADLDIKTQNLHLASAPDCFSEHTPLHIAVAKGYLGVSKLLIEAGADFSAKNGLQQTIMDIAKEGKKEIEKIIREYVPINAISIRRAVKSVSLESIKIMINDRQIDIELLSGCLCIAASSGKNDLVKYLLGHGVNIDKEYQEKSPLEWAMFGRNIQTVKTFINAGAGVNKKDKYGRTSLFQYVKDSNTEIVQFLVDKGVDVNVGDRDGKAAIHYANDKEIIKILINAGVDINVRDRNGETRLFQIVMELDTKMVQFLVEKGADLNTGDRYGYAPIHYANDKAIMEVLINAGADVNVKDKHGKTPLIQFLKESDTEMVQFLVDKGANVNVKDGDGNTFIRYANNKEVAEILINAGADINAKGPYGIASLIHHVRESNAEMVQFLVDKRVDVNATNEDGKTAIRYANDKEIIKILVNAGADVNAKNEREETPLFRFVTKAATEMVQFLVDKGADVNAANRYGYTPIHCTNNRKIMEILINAGADVNLKDKYGRTPLIQYVKDSNTDIVQFLLDKRADVNAKGKYGKTPIYYANDEEIIRILINAGADVNAEDEYGGTPLIKYVTESNAEIVQFLVDKGADVNARDKDGKTPIRYANDKEIIKILVNAGADVNAKNERGETSLLRFVKESNAEVVQFLVDKEADVNATDKDGKAAIHYANDKEIMEIIINAGADVNLKDRGGKTCLIHCVKKSDAEVVQFLINKGADINAKDDDGNTPVSYAHDKETMRILINAGADINVTKYGTVFLALYANGSDADIVQFLVKKGVDVNARDENGKTAIHYANDKKIMEILINTGADVNSKDRDGKTPLIDHVKNSNTEIVQFLVDKGANVNVKDDDGNTFICFANNKEVAEILINAGADVNAKGPYGIASLIHHVRESNAEMVQFLVDKRVDVNATNEDGKTAIRYANDKEIIKILVNAGADVNAKNERGETSLLRFVKESNAEVVQFLVDKEADVNAVNRYGYAPIHYTNNRKIMEILINAGANVNVKDKHGKISLIHYVKNLDIEIIQFLLDKGADVNAIDKDENAPIHYVRDKEIAEILVNAGANINIKDRFGKKLFDILMNEQNINLSNSQYKRKKICELLNYLKDII